MRKGKKANKIINKRREIKHGRTRKMKHKKKETQQGRETKEEKTTFCFFVAVLGCWPLSEQKHCQGERAQNTMKHGFLLFVVYLLGCSWANKQQEQQEQQQQQQT